MNRAVAALSLLLLFASPAFAQDPPPRIGPFVVDVQGTFPKFTDDPQLAASRGLSQADMPGTGLGLHAGAHVYVFSWKALTVGIGGDLTLARSTSESRPISATERTTAVTERFTHIAPALSFNFGDGNGWSYLSGGIGPSKWSLVPNGAAPAAADEEQLFTINYGGGARWFAKRHLAFSFDVRFYAIDPGTPVGSRPGSPRTTLLIMGAGISLK